MTPQTSIAHSSRWNRIATLLLLGLSLFFASLLLYKLVKHGKGVNISFVLTSAALALAFAWATKFSFENKLRICLFSLSSILTVLAFDGGSSGIARRTF